MSLLATLGKAHEVLARLNFVLHKQPVNKRVSPSINLCIDKSSWIVRRDDRGRLPGNRLLRVTGFGHKMYR